MQIANRRYYDHIRALYRDKRKIDKIKEHQTIFTEGDKAFTSIEKREKVLILNMAIDDLKPEYSEVLRMKYIEEKSLIDITKAVGKSFKTRESLLYRARQALKKKMGKLFNEF